MLYSKSSDGMGCRAIKFINTESNDKTIALETIPTNRLSCPCNRGKLEINTEINAIYRRWLSGRFNF